MKKKATVTIIIVTTVYIIFNLPVFLNYVRFIVTVYGKQKDIQNVFLQKYIWLLTYIITVALNSLVNPLIYVLRMRRFRAEALNIFKKEPVMTYNAHSHTDTTNNVVLANRNVMNNNNSTRSCATVSTFPTNQDSLKSTPSHSLSLRKPSVCSVGLGTADIRADPPTAMVDVSRTKSIP